MAIMPILPIPVVSSSRFLGARRLFWTGLSLLALGGGLLFLLLAPALEQEFRYWQQTNSERFSPIVIQDGDASDMSVTGAMQPLDTDFGIIIPKIGANARVVPEVDWQDARVYQKALQQGVAHAAGTALPGELGNVFIFAHSGVDFSEAARYNAVFYLMNKLVPGDEVRLFRKGKEYRYAVVETKKVASDAVEYLAQDESREILTLMTCWPAGTTLKRLIVRAERTE